jgi:signal transduction histidine kinase
MRFRAIPFSLFCLLLAAVARADESLKTAHWFYSLEEALRDPEAVRKLNLSDQGLTEFPRAVFDLPNLQMLMLNDNRLSALPADLGRLSKLSEIELNRNAFVEFPRELLDLVTLNELELSGNRITELPADITRLISLTELEVRENDLASLPPELGRLAYLEDLEVDYNRIEEVPAAVFNAPVLSVFTAAGNRLRGLPENIGEARSLRELDVSRNRITRLPDSTVELRLALAHVWQESLERLSPAQLDWLLSAAQHDLPDFILQLAQARRPVEVDHYFEALLGHAGGDLYRQSRAFLVGARAYRDLGDNERARSLVARARDGFTRLQALADDDDGSLSRATVHANLREVDTLFALIETEANQERLRWLLRSALLAGLALVAGFFLLLTRSHRRLRVAHDLLSRQTALLEDQTARLERLNATKDRLFSLIGHDLRGPLSALGTLSGRLRPELSTPSSQRLVSLLEGTALQLSALLDNLLRWAQSHIREARFEPAFVDLGELVEAVVGQYRALLAMKEIDLRVALGDGLHVYGDATMLETIVRNLLANAVKFSETGDRIAISAEARNGEVVLEVADTGVGMSGEQIARLFDPEAARTLEGTRGERGTGLGLLLCEDFVRRHEGRIEVRSMPGEGSVFCVVLPACGLSAAAAD